MTRVCVLLLLVSACAAQVLQPVVEPAAGGDGTTVLTNNAGNSDGHSTVLTGTTPTPADPKKLTVDPVMYAPMVIAGQENKCGCMMETVCPCRTGYYPAPQVAVVATAALMEEKAALTPLTPPDREMRPVTELQQEAYSGGPVDCGASPCPAPAVVRTDGAALPAVDATKLTSDPVYHPNVVIAGSSSLCSCLAMPICPCRPALLEEHADPGTTVLQPAAQPVQALVPGQAATIMVTAPDQNAQAPCTTCGETTSTWNPAVKSIAQQYPVQPSYSLVAEAEKQAPCGCVALPVCACRPISQWVTPEITDTCGCPVCPCVVTRSVTTCGCTVCPCQQYVKPLEPEYRVPEVKTTPCPCVGMPTCGC